MSRKSALATTSSSVGNGAPGRRPACARGSVGKRAAHAPSLSSCPGAMQLTRMPSGADLTLGAIWAEGSRRAGLGGCRVRRHRSCLSRVQAAITAQDRTADTGLAHAPATAGRAVEVVLLRTIDHGAHASRSARRWRARGGWAAALLISSCGGPSAAPAFSATCRHPRPPDRACHGLREGLRHRAAQLGCLLDRLCGARNGDRRAAPGQ